MALDFSNLGGFEWDSGNLEHIKKHDISREECEELFLNRPLILTTDESHSQNEERMRALGQTNIKRLITLFFTIRENKIRIISARDQSKKERKEYQEAGGEIL